jgi:peptidoglycan hydrolase-like protein with peptidoglycan-binding domain
VKSASYDKTFTVESCTTGSETDVVVNAKDGGLTATVTAWGGSGALKVDGGDEGDGVSLDGILDTVEVGDSGDVTGAGTFAAPNFKGESFTISGSCAGTQPATTTTAPGSKDVAKAAKADLEVWQRDLNTVGCFSGVVDGTSGPQTVSAVRAFQAASGLTPDGVLGPKTETALKDAAAAKRVVCVSPTDGGAAATKSRLVLSAPSFNKTFLVGTCKSGGETSVQLVGQADGLTVKLSANNGTGTLSVDGSTESDGITLKGNVSSVTVGDTGDVTVKGTFSAPNFAGEQFTATGSCA